MANACYIAAATQLLMRMPDLFKSVKGVGFIRDYVTKFMNTIDPWQASANIAVGPRICLDRDLVEGAVKEMPEGEVGRQDDSAGFIRLLLDSGDRGSYMLKENNITTRYADKEGNRVIQIYNSDGSFKEDFTTRKEGIDCEMIMLPYAGYDVDFNLVLTSFVRVPDERIQDKRSKMSDLPNGQEYRVGGEKYESKQDFDGKMYDFAYLGNTYRYDDLKKYVLVCNKIFQNDGSKTTFEIRLEDVQLLFNDAETLKYTITSVVVHIGKSISGGHYINLSRDEDGRRWHILDDSTVATYADFKTAWRETKSLTSARPFIVLLTRVE